MIDSPFEKPHDSYIHVETHKEDLETSKMKLLEALLPLIKYN